MERIEKIDYLVSIYDTRPVMDYSLSPPLLFITISKTLLKIIIPKEFIKDLAINLLHMELSPR